MKRILIALIAFLLLTSLASAATLQVGPKFHYKTIQSAVNEANDGDTIQVAAGTYNEKVIVNDKRLIFEGQKVGNKYKYPTVYGFKFGWDEGKSGAGNITGFKITKNGIDYAVAGGNTVKNNYLYNCNIGMSGSICSDNIIMNNQIKNGTISFGPDSYSNVATGNRITESAVGIQLHDADCNIYKNTITHCEIGILYLSSGFQKTTDWNGIEDKKGYAKDQNENVFKGNTVDIRTSGF